MTDLSGSPQHIPSNQVPQEPTPETDSPAAASEQPEIPIPSPTPDDLKSDPPSDEPQILTQEILNEPSDGVTPEMSRGNRSPTLSSTSSIVTKSSSPMSHKYVNELLDSHIFISSSEPSEISVSDLEELCGRAFSDQHGMDLFLQILDEKRGRCSELTLIGFHNMKMAMKVSRVFSLSLLIDPLSLDIFRSMFGNS